MAEINIKENIKNQLLDSEAKKFYSQLKENFPALKLQASNFLQTVFQLKEQQTQDIMQDHINNLSKKISSIYQKMRENTEFTREMTSAGEKFATKVDEFLGRITIFAYTSQLLNWDYEILDEISMIDIYKTIATSNKGRGNIGQKEMVQKLSQNQNQPISEHQYNQKLISALKEHIKTAHEERKGTLISTIARWEHSINLGQSQKRIYYYLKKHQITFSQKRFNTIGVITETYLQQMIAENEQIKIADTTPHLEQKDSSFETAIQTLQQKIQKDSRGAALGQDVSIKIDDNHYDLSIEIAAKQGKFSTARIGQYIKLARNILQFTELTSQELKKLLPKLSRYNAIEKISTNTEKQLNELVPNFVNKLIKNS